MNQAVADLFEAGFLGLEQRLATVPAFAPRDHTPGLGHPLVQGHDLSDISRTLGSMSLRQTGPHILGMEATSGANAFQHER